MLGDWLWRLTKHLAASSGQAHNLLFSFWRGFSTDVHGPFSMQGERPAFW